MLTYLTVFYKNMLYYLVLGSVGGCCLQMA